MNSKAQFIVMIAIIMLTSAVFLGLAELIYLLAVRGFQS